jgi:hypothetical protein
VTLIAALRTAECVLLAADSETHNQAVRVSVRKLGMLDQRPIAWGFAGDESIGLDFGAWLKERDWTESEDWESFREAAARALAALNGRRRTLAELSKATLAPESFTDVLIAGYIQAQSGILELDSDGGSSLRSMLDLVAIGSGKNHAIIVLQTLKALNGLRQFNAAQLLRMIMGIAATTAPECGPPIRFLRITTTGVEEIDSPTSEIGGPTNAASK